MWPLGSELILAAFAEDSDLRGSFFQLVELLQGCGLLLQGLFVCSFHRLKKLKRGRGR